MDSGTIEISGNKLSNLKFKITGRGGDGEEISGTFSGSFEEKSDIGI